MWHFETHLKQRSDPSHSNTDKYTESRMKENVLKRTTTKNTHTHKSRVVSPNCAGEFILFLSAVLD